MNGFVERAPVITSSTPSGFDRSNHRKSAISLIFPSLVPEKERQLLGVPALILSMETVLYQIISPLIKPKG
jgi:hypothetical protein